jgi:hypothetical protein
MAPAFDFTPARVERAMQGSQRAQQGRAVPNAEGAKSGVAKQRGPRAAWYGPVVGGDGPSCVHITAAADQGQGSRRGKGGGVQALAASLQALKARLLQ